MSPWEKKGNGSPWYTPCVISTSFFFFPFFPWLVLLKADYGEYVCTMDQAWESQAHKQGRYFHRL
jgi:hypothetical protein